MQLNAYLMIGTKWNFNSFLKLSVVQLGTIRLVGIWNCTDLSDTHTDVIWCAFYTLWTKKCPATLLTEARRKVSLWWLSKKQIVGMNIIGIQDIFNSSPVDFKMLRNLIKWSRVVSWKRIDPNVHINYIWNDFKAPVLFSADFVARNSHQDRPDLIDSLLIDM